MITDLTDKLFLGDCLQIMREIPDNEIDITITSPPFNLGNNHHTGNIRHTPYFDNFPESAYQLSQIDALNEIYRITKQEGSLFYQHKNRIKQGVSITPYEWILKTKWIIKQELVWFNGSQNFDKIRFYPMTERVYWLTKIPETKLNNVINHHDFFKWNAEGTQKEHTRTFPEEMVKDILLCFLNAKLVFDPFMGTGTTCKVAKQIGKNYCGIEMDKAYFDLATQNISNYQTLLNTSPV